MDTCIPARIYHPSNFDKGPVQRLTTLTQ